MGLSLFSKFCQLAVSFAALDRLYSSAERAIEAPSGGRLIASAFSAAGLMVALLLPELAEADDLWSLPPVAGNAYTPSHAARVSAFGIEIGSYAIIQGAGKVFYAGRAEGDVYFAELDEPGVFDWKAALAACGMKGTGWSLPTASQLKLLNKNASEIDLMAKEVRDTQGFWYWSSSPGEDGFAYRVRPFDGLGQPAKKKFAARVRCVRVY